MRPPFFLVALLLLSLGCPGGNTDTSCTGPDCPCIGLDCPCTGPDCPCIGPDCPCLDPSCPCAEPGCLPFEEIPWPIYRPTNTTDRYHDADCDGIPDWEEEEIGTNPQNRDTDGDGIWDGIEIGRYSTKDPACEGFFPKNLLPPTRITNPLRKDSDCDGLSDGDEDKNKNGRFEPELGETDPTNPDTDEDGLWDGVERGVTREMAADPDNCPHAKYARSDCPRPLSKTDPLNPDSDNDEIPDGIEDTNQNGCFEPELSLHRKETNPKDKDDPGTTTPENWAFINACSLNNLTRIDISRNFVAQIALGLPMGFANSYVNIQRTNDAGVTTVGLMGFEARRNVAFVAWRYSGTVTSYNALENLARAHAVTIGGTATTNPFTSWDASAAQAKPNAVSVNFQIPASVSETTPHISPVTRVNTIAENLLGPGPGLTAPSAAGPTQHVRAQYVLRDNNNDGVIDEVIVVMAVALDNNSVSGSDGYFGLMDVAGGAALARYFDRTVLQCDRGVASRSLVDFLFVVDDSGSMGTSQARLAVAGEAMAQALSRSSLDWRVALVTSSYHLTGTSGNRSVVYGFTSDAQEFQAWLRQNSWCEAAAGGAASTCSRGCTETEIRAGITVCRSGTELPDWQGNAPTCSTSTPGTNNGCWIDITGASEEGMLGAARKALIDINRNNGFRANADIVVIILSDTEDQTTGYQASAWQSSPSNWEHINNFIQFFRGSDENHTVAAAGAPGGSVQPIRPGPIPVHAIYCPAGQNCGDNHSVPSYNNDSNNPDRLTRIQRVVRATAGASAPINGSSSAIGTTIADIVNRIIGATGVKAQKPFIGASLRVAIHNPEGVCKTDMDNPHEISGSNVPRDRRNGFDYDGFSQTVSFFGNCRPPLNATRAVAISYRAWESSDQKPCENDVRFIDNPALGYCKGNFICNVDQDRCLCPDDCGGCHNPALPICNNETTCECSAVVILQ